MEDVQGQVPIELRALCASTLVRTLRKAPRCSDFALLPKGRHSTWRTFKSGKADNPRTRKYALALSGNGPIAVWSGAYPFNGKSGRSRKELGAP